MRPDIVFLLANMCSALPVSAAVYPEVILHIIRQIHEICKWAAFCPVVRNLKDTTSTTITRQKASSAILPIPQNFMHVISRKEVILWLCRIVPLGIPHYPFGATYTKRINKLVSDIVRMAYNSPHIDLVFGDHYATRIVTCLFPYAT